MSRALVMALYAFVPAVLLFSLAILTGWHFDEAVILLVIAELKFATDCSRRMVAFKRTHGNLPFSLRVPLLPWAAGCLAYVLIGSGSLHHPVADYVGLLAAFAIVASKLWFNRGPISPYADS